MNEYEIVLKYCNGCAGEAYPTTTFEEAEAESPEAYLRQKHGKDGDKFRKEVQPDGRVHYVFDTGCVKYTYEFTLI